MSHEVPSTNDIQLIFKKLRAIATNKSCFDCQAKLPTWSSITYGVFICIDCSAVHRSLGVHLTFVRSTQLDTNWTWLQLRQMQLGGNANAESFFRHHNCVTTDAQQKYNSRAAQLYRDKLHSAAIQAMRLHGNKLHLEAPHEPTTGTKEKDVDFFEEHSSKESEFDNDNQSNVADARIANANRTSLSSDGPNVEAALSGPVDPTPDRKSIIGARKPAAKKTGLGTKKVGLGAQRVKANFADIEREAELADQLKLQEKIPVEPEKTPEEQEAQMTSMRLAYQDLSLQQKKEEEKLKSIDPKKAKQVERLGMGYGSRTGVSHSAFSNMKTIEQETPVKQPNSRFIRDDDSNFDDFFDTFSCPGLSMYKGKRIPTESFDTMIFENSKSESIVGSGEATNRSGGSSKSSSVSRWSESTGGGGWANSGWHESAHVCDYHKEKIKRNSNWEEPERRQPSIKAPEKVSSPVTDEAQKKFGTAKSISSAQYFGDANDNSWEKKTNLSRFEGSSSISSAEYFNRDTTPAGGAYSVQTPDLEDVRESVRQGVTKVAGKLSSLANGVMSSIQEKYSGGY